MPAAISISSLKTEYLTFPDDKLIEALEQVFTHMYTCAKPWSAWKDGTMQREDFIPLDRKDELFHDLLIGFKNAYLENSNNKDIDIEKLLMDTLDKEEMDPLFNKNIQKKFYENRFYPMTCAKTDLSPLVLMISDYQLEISKEYRLNEQRKARKKTRMVA